MSVQNGTDDRDVARSSYDKIWTLPNIISFARLCLIPLYLVLLMGGHDIWATIIYAVAALTDFVDGQVARRTNSVSRLGTLMDPAIDTLLMITGVLGVFIVGRVPLWVVVIIFARELFLLIGGAILLKGFHIQIPVIYPGKVATTLLFFGFSGLLLFMPSFAGPGWTDATWLVGFDSSVTSWGIYFVYLGLILQIIVTLYYCVQAVIKLKQKRRTDFSSLGGA